MKEILTRRECSAMRGIAILAIMLHNYCHFIGKIVKENEYMYQAGADESRRTAACASALLLRPLRCAGIPLPQRLRSGDEIRKCSR